MKRNIYQLVETVLAKNPMKKTAEEIAVTILKDYPMRKTAKEIASAILCKSAEITPEEIASGLAGKPTREISPEEVSQYAEQEAMRAREQHKNAPLYGGIAGGALGGLTGMAMGSSGKRAIPGLVGLGLGGGLGALLGFGTRAGAQTQARNLGQTVGNIASTGHIPYTFPRGIATDDLIPYAEGYQGKPVTIDPNEENQIREKLTNRLMLLRGAEGAIRGGTIGALAGRNEKGELNADDALLHAAIHGGASTLRGRAEARHMAQQILDLKSRGYGTLADRYYSEALDPEILGY